MDPNTTPDVVYSPPKVEDLGTLSDQTREIINKIGTVGDVIVINGQSIVVPGSQVL